MKFLEIVDRSKGSLLLNIKKINRIVAIGFESDWSILVVMEKGEKYEEKFENDFKKCSARYAQIKSIIDAK